MDKTCCHIRKSWNVTGNCVKLRMSSGFTYFPSTARDRRTPVIPNRIRNRHWPTADSTTWTVKHWNMELRSETLSRGGDVVSGLEVVTQFKHQLCNKSRKQFLLTSQRRVQQSGPASGAGCVKNGQQPYSDAESPGGFIAGFHLCNIPSQSDAEKKNKRTNKSVHAVVASRLRYCNSLFTGRLEFVWIAFSGSQGPAALISSVGRQSDWKQI